VKPGQELVFSFTDKLIQGIRHIQKFTCPQGAQERKYCLCCRKKEMGNVKMGNINVNKAGTYTA